MPTQAKFENCDLTETRIAELRALLPACYLMLERSPSENIAVIHCSRDLTGPEQTTCTDDGTANSETVSFI